MNVKTSLGDLILLALENAVDGYVRLEDYMYNTSLYAWGYDRPLRKSVLSQAIKRLREKGLIDFDTEGDIILRLTKAGRNKALIQKVQQKGQKWDGKWRLVSFDIPENKRKTRNLLRYQLKSWGFIPWQQSLWASKTDCVNELRNFIKEVGIERWVIIIETDNFDKH